MSDERTQETTDITDEDLCAKCAHLNLVGPKQGYSSGKVILVGAWHAEAACAKAWPFKSTFHNVICECPAFSRNTA